MKIKEILVVHHSHFDVGYTHSQPILWELQREFIDGALDLLDATARFPEEARPRWTCEVTAQVIKWLESAEADKIEKFRRYALEKRIGISAMLCHITPLNNAEQLMRQLYPARQLREQFGVSINTLNQHDINGVPWALADVMLDSGIDLFIMAINRHLGGFAAERPAVIRWKAPSGREIKVMNGAHYTMFDQLFDTHKNDLDEMQAGIEYYFDFLEKVKKYRHDFVYLTTANAPVCYDNSPPNIEVAELIRRWNDEGREPLIRYVTPEQLSDRVKELPDDEMPLYSGDWTDFWNFGCASNAHITKTNINAKPKLFGAELMAACRSGAYPPAIEAVAQKAWWNLNFYDEHTWGAYNSMDFDNSFARAQAHIKDHFAFQASELAEYLLVNELEALAENPPQSNHQEGILLVNASPTERREYLPVPDSWFNDGKRLRTARQTWTQRELMKEGAPLYGPINLPPFSWKKIPFDKLKKAANSKAVKSGPAVAEADLPIIENRNFDTIIRRPQFMESKFYRLEFDQPTGRITALYDKTRNWQVIDPNSQWTFFEFVHEAPDPLVDSGRTAFYKRSMYKEKYDIECWQYNWKARRQGAGKTLGCAVEHHPRGATLTMRFEAPGCEWIEQSVTLLADSPLIELQARIMKKDIRTPESLFFAFPLQLQRGWRSHFNSAGVPIALDSEQLPGASRDWVTVESFAAVHEADRGATLYCPDAPMVQIGDFNFGKGSKTIRRDENPLLLAWPLNSYWDTNFRPSQPGLVEIRYAFKTHDKFDAVNACREGRQIATAIEVHPLIKCKRGRSGRFFNLEGENGESLDVEVLHVKPAEGGDGAIFRMINIGGRSVKAVLEVPGKKIRQAFQVTPLEEDLKELPIAKNKVWINLPPRTISSVRVGY